MNQKENITSSTAGKIKRSNKSVVFCLNQVFINGTETCVCATQSYSIQAPETNGIINMESMITLNNVILARSQKMMMRHSTTLVLPVHIYLFHSNNIHANHAVLFINMLGHIPPRP